MILRVGVNTAGKSSWWNERVGDMVAWVGETLDYVSNALRVGRAFGVRSSTRSALVVFALVAIALGTTLSVPPAIAEASSDPCFGGLVASNDDSGQVTGTDCSDVIVASAETTSIKGGDGDDVIIGAPNVVVISGGDGWDYIVGNSVGTIVLGGAGDDIIDAGEAPTPKNLSRSVKRQIESAASVLPDLEASVFRSTVNKELEIARDYSHGDADLNLRQHSMDTDPLVQQVIGTQKVEIDGVDDEKEDQIASLQRKAQEYADATREVAGKIGRVANIRQDLGHQSSLMAAKDPVFGSLNDDILIGGRGTDEIHGQAGNDVLYGGIDDDKLFGESDNDYLLGGMGADFINGGPGDDIAQGDATGDKMSDTSGSNDVLSFVSGGTDGFPTMNMSAYPNFPPVNSPERGVYVNLGAGIASNGSVLSGGGSDSAASLPDDGTVFANFEHVVGTPFADYIVGDSGANILQGGGGSDVINGGGGTVADFLIGDAGGDNLTAPVGSWILGGAGEDYCGGSTTVAECEPKPSNWVGVRYTGTMSVGMSTQSWAGNAKSQLYVAGSTGNWLRNGVDTVNVTQYDDGSGPPSYYFTTPGPSSTDGQFSIAPEDQTPGCSYSATVVLCSPNTNVTTMVLSGFGAADHLDAINVFRMTNTVILGGEGHDTLTGSYLADDFIVDGAGSDALQGQGGDDGFINSDGQDSLWGADGDDLVVSSAVCQGDTLGGGPGTDSASWAQYDTGSSPGTNYGVFANISTDRIGKNVGGALNCGASPENSFSGIEDLEGSRHYDVLRGDSGPNQLIGRATSDRLEAYGGADRVLANSADADNVVDCGNQTDRAVIDFGWDGAISCEDTSYGDPIFPDG